MEQQNLQFEPTVYIYDIQLTREDINSIVYCLAKGNDKVTTETIKFLLPRFRALQQIATVEVNYELTKP